MVVLTIIEVDLIALAKLMVGDVQMIVLAELKIVVVLMLALEELKIDALLNFAFEVMIMVVELVEVMIIGIDYLALEVETNSLEHYQ